MLLATIVLKTDNNEIVLDRDGSKVDITVKNLFKFEKHQKIVKSKKFVKTRHSKQLIFSSSKVSNILCMKDSYLWAIIEALPKRLAV